MTDFLKTKRLTIQFTEPSHFEDILQLRSDPDVQRFTTQGAQNRQAVERFMKIIGSSPNQRRFLFYHNLPVVFF